MSRSPHKPLERVIKYLIRQISPLKPQIGADVFVDGPGKFIVKLPRYDTHQNGADGHDDGQSDCEGLDDCIEIRSQGLPATVFFVDGIPNLIRLYRRLDEKADVVNAEPNNLNRVLELQ